MNPPGPTTDERIARALERIADAMPGPCEYCGAPGAQLSTCFGDGNGHEVRACAGCAKGSLCPEHVGGDETGTRAAPVPPDSDARLVEGLLRDLTPGCEDLADLTRARLRPRFDTIVRSAGRPFGPPTVEALSEALHAVWTFPGHQFAGLDPVLARWRSRLTVAGGWLARVECAPPWPRVGRCAAEALAERLVDAMPSDIVGEAALRGAIGRRFARLLDGAPLPLQPCVLQQLVAEATSAIEEAGDALPEFAARCRAAVEAMRVPWWGVLRATGHADRSGGERAANAAAQCLRAAPLDNFWSNVSLRLRAALRTTRVCTSQALAGRLLGEVRAELDRYHVYLRSPAVYGRWRSVLRGATAPTAVADDYSHHPAVGGDGVEFSSGECDRAASAVMDWLGMGGLVRKLCAAAELRFDALGLSVAAFEGLGLDLGAVLVEFRDWLGTLQAQDELAARLLALPSAQAKGPLGVPVEELVGRLVRACDGAIGPMTPPMTERLDAALHAVFRGEDAR